MPRKVKHLVERARRMNEIIKRRRLEAHGIATESDNTGCQGSEANATNVGPISDSILDSPMEEPGTSDSPMVDYENKIEPIFVSEMVLCDVKEVRPEVKESETKIQKESVNETQPVACTEWQGEPVCRVCFVTDCKLYSMIVHRTLASAYKKMTGFSVLKEGLFPPYLCAECATRLMNSARFRARTLYAHTTMRNILKKHNHVSQKLLKSTLAKRRIGTKFIRSYTRTNEYDLKIDHEKEMEKVTNKINVEKNLIDDNNIKNGLDCESKDEEDATNAQDPLDVNIKEENDVIEVKIENDIDINNEKLHFTDLDENTVILDLNRSVIHRRVTNDNVMNNVDENINKTPALHEDVSENNVLMISEPVLRVHVPDRQDPSAWCKVTLDNNQTDQTIFTLDNVTLSEMGR